MNDLQSTLLILSASFSSTSCCFSSGITLKIVAFSLRRVESSCLCCGLLLCSSPKVKTGSVFSAFCLTPLSTHALITCCIVSRVGCKYTLFDGLAYNTCGYFASCVVFFRAPQGRGKIRAMSKMSARIIC